MMISDGQHYCISFKKSEKSVVHLLELNELIKVAGYKANIQNLVTFIYANNKQIEFKMKSAVPFTLAIPSN